MLTLVISNKNVANYCGLLFACLHLPYFLQHASITFAMTKSSTVLHVKHFLECLSPAQTSLLTSRLRNPLLAVPSTRARTQGWRLLLLLVVVQLLSCFQLSASPWTAARQASCPSPSPGACSNTSIESVMPSNHLILCHPLLLLPSICPSIRGFSNESALCTRWSKYQSSNFNISPSKEYSGLISFRIDWWYYCTFFFLLFFLNTENFEKINAKFPSHSKVLTS